MGDYLQQDQQHNNRMTRKIMVSNKHSWQQALSNIITDPKELWSLLDLDSKLLDEAYMAAQQFPLKVPRSFVARMQKGNLHDPLLKQVLPLGIELDRVS